MKKFFICSFLTFFVFGVFPTFAMEHKEMLSFIEKQGHNFLTHGDYYSSYYLAQDKDGILFLYNFKGGQSQRNIEVFKEVGALTKEEVSQLIKESFLPHPVIEEENEYTVYKLTILLVGDFYCVQTPRRNWYFLKKIKEIDTILEGL